MTRLPTLIEVDQEIARRSLSEFCKMAWHVLEPATPIKGSVRISVSGEVIPGAAQRGCPLYLRCSMPDLMR